VVGKSNGYSTWT